jgi:hypothetical protein
MAIRIDRNRRTAFPFGQNNVFPEGVNDMEYEIEGPEFFAKGEGGVHWVVI